MTRPASRKPWMKRWPRCADSPHQQGGADALEPEVRPYLAVTLAEERRSGRHGTDCLGEGGIEAIGIFLDGRVIIEEARIEMQKPIETTGSGDLEEARRVEVSVRP